MNHPNGRALLPWCSVALVAVAARMVAPRRRADGPGLGW